MIVALILLMFFSSFWIMVYSYGMIPQTKTHFLRVMKADQLKEIVKEFKNDSGSNTCKKVKKLFGGNGDIGRILENYPNDIYTFENGIESKKAVIENYIGINDKFTGEHFDDKIDLCLDPSSSNGSPN